MPLLIKKLSPLRRPHRANLIQTLLLKDIIFLSTLVGASLAPPTGLCQPATLPPHVPKQSLHPPFPRLQVSDEQGCLLSEPFPRQHNPAAPAPAAAAT